MIAQNVTKVKNNAYLIRKNKHGVTKQQRQVTGLDGVYEHITVVAVVCEMCGLFICLFAFVCVCESVCFI